MLPSTDINSQYCDTDVDSYNICILLYVDDAVLITPNEFEL